LRFSARLSQNRKAASANGSATRLNIPAAIDKKLKGMDKVEGTINGHPFRAGLESGDTAGRSLRVNQAMLRGAGAGAGDTVHVAILGPEGPPKPPADLQRELAASRGAKAFWKDLNDDSRRIYIRWIEGAKTPETRAKRVRRTVEQLAEGKRRPCCVNVYEFMLQRVEE
jgi:hypothetical protein